MAKKYMSEHTRAKHSYKFFKERRNDPEWQEEFYEVRRLHWRSIFIKSIITVVLVIVFGIIASLYIHHSNARNSQEEQTASETASSSISDSTSSSIQEQYTTNQKSNSSVSSQSSSSSIMSNEQQAQKYLLNKSYTITPTLFNGEDIDSAMDDGNAPQNAVHDNFAVVKFTGSNTASVRYAMSTSVSTESYTLTNTNLTIANKTFPYTITNGNVSFGNYTNSDEDGNQYTFSMQPN